MASQVLDIRDDDLLLTDSDFNSHLARVEDPLDFTSVDDLSDHDTFRFEIGRQNGRDPGVVVEVDLNSTQT